VKIIEIEKKVNLNPQQLRKIEQEGRFLNEKKVHDRYFDTNDYRYTTQNKWLRQRDGSFELKVGIAKQNGALDRYEEITDERTILQHLGANPDENLLQALSQNGLFPFCDFVTLRKSYQLHELKIDIDETDFGEFKYRVAEIEMIVSDLDQVQDAEQKISQLIKEMEIDVSVPTPAKLTYYLYYKRPEHYRTLVLNKVIQPIILHCIPQCLPAT
jgi:adenylate cyclase class IV